MQAGERFPEAIGDDQDNGTVVEAVGRGMRSILEVGDLSRAIEVNVHFNRLSSLEGLPRGLKNVRVLNLSSNEFQSCNLPQLAFIPTLAMLDLAGNAIQTLEDMPFLPGVVDVSFAFNCLTHISGLENIPNVRRLDVRGNMLAHPRDVLPLRSARGIEGVELADSDGRNANPLCARVPSVLGLFDLCPSLVEIDKKGREDWPHLSDLNLTPKFDALAHKYLKDTAAGRGHTSPTSASLTTQLQQMSPHWVGAEVPLQIDVATSPTSPPCPAFPCSAQGTSVRMVRVAAAQTTPSISATEGFGAWSDGQGRQGDQGGQGHEFNRDADVGVGARAAVAVSDEGSERNPWASNEHSEVPSSSVFVTRTGNVHNVRDVSRGPRQGPKRRQGAGQEVMAHARSTHDNYDDEKEEEVEEEKEVEDEEEVEDDSTFEAETAEMAALVATEQEARWEAALALAVRRGLALGRMAGTVNQLRQRQLRRAMAVLASGGTSCDNNNDDNKSSSGNSRSIAWGPLKELLVLSRKTSHMARREWETAAERATDLAKWEKKMSFKESQIESLKRRLVSQEATLGRKTATLQADVVRLTNELEVSRTQATEDLASAAAVATMDTVVLRSEIECARQESSMRLEEVRQLEAELKASTESLERCREALEANDAARRAAEERSLASLASAESEIARLKEMLEAQATGALEVAEASSVAVTERDEAQALVFTLQADLERGEVQWGARLTQEEMGRARAEDRLKRMKAVLEETTAASSERIGQLTNKLKTQRSGMSKLAEVTRELKTALMGMRQRVPLLEQRLAHAEQRAVRAEKTQEEIMRVRSHVVDLERAVLASRGRGRGSENCRETASGNDDKRDGSNVSATMDPAVETSGFSQGLSVDYGDKRAEGGNYDTIDNDNDHDDYDDNVSAVVEAQAAALHDLRGQLVEADMALRVKDTMLEDQNMALSELREEAARQQTELGSAVRRGEELEEDLYEARTAAEELEEQLQVSYVVERKLRKLIHELTEK